MSTQSRCQVSARDFTILEVILERTSLHDEAFRRLLRRKLSMATVVFHEDVDPQVATINSQVEYSVDGGPPDTRILVHGDARVLPGRTLPVTTLHGLALVGLRVDDTIVIERADGISEEVRLCAVVRRPDAAPGTATASSKVVELRPRRKPADRPTEGPSDLDDDPGPHAA